MQQFTFQLLVKDSNQEVPNIPPYIFRGVVLDFLNTVDPKFVAELHRPNEIRPYAIAVTREPPFLNLRLVCLQEAMSQAILQRLMKEENIPLLIAGWEFVMVRINIESIPLVNLMRDPQKVVKFQLRFLMPTYFNIRDRPIDMRFPESVFLFPNLAKVWNQYAAEECQVDDGEFYQWVSQHVSVSSYKLQTRPVKIDRQVKVFGCVGWAKYLNNDPANIYASWVDILLKFAEYVNVGGNRTAGCGVIRYSPLEWGNNGRKQPDNEEGENNQV